MMLALILSGLVAAAAMTAASRPKPEPGRVPVRVKPKSGRR
jgi:hypothetical protein